MSRFEELKWYILRSELQIMNNITHSKGGVIDDGALTSSHFWQEVDGFD